MVDRLREAIRSKEASRKEPKTHCSTRVEDRGPQSVGLLTRAHPLLSTTW
jgi:hypothetical protein